MGILEVRAEDTGTNQQEWQAFTDAEVKSRIDVAGTIITKVHAGPTLENGECAWWLDVTTDPPTVTFTAKVSGNVYVGQVKMQLQP